MRRKTNKVTYSNYFQAYIVCVKYISDDHWYFIFRDAVGKQSWRRAKTKYSYFTWF